MNYIEKISRNKYFYLFLLLVFISTLLSIFYSVNCITDFSADEHIYLEQVYSFTFDEELSG